jgi:uncharacterized protein (DUF427 family)
MDDYPRMIAPVNHVEPVPRRVRGIVGTETVFDSTRALYLWEWANYPQYYIPAGDFHPAVLVPEGENQHSKLGTFQAHGLQVGDDRRSGAAKLFVDSPLPGIAGTVRVHWPALDAWFEEDEQVFVHPRNPYVRVDALRSSRQVRVEMDGVVLARSSSPVMVFETGLPTRYYLNRTDVDFAHLEASGTVTECPYKGTTSGYWSVRIKGELEKDLAWAYDFPTRQLLPIAGLIAFYNEKVDIFLDDQPLERPKTHFFR